MLRVIQTSKDLEKAKKTCFHLDIHHNGLFSRGNLKSFVEAKFKQEIGFFNCKRLTVKKIILHFCLKSSRITLAFLYSHFQVLQTRWYSLLDMGQKSDQIENKPASSQLRTTKAEPGTGKFWDDGSILTFLYLNYY